MRDRASILHVDADSFFAAVEQWQKPSLAGRPVLVGGIGPRGVVATASYEARTLGAHSAMAMHHARKLCPDAAIIAPRFAAYSAHSAVLMGLLRESSPLVEPLSIDEAFVDLDVGDELCADPVVMAATIRSRMRAATGLAVTAGLGRSKLIAKLASGAGKPDGLLVISPDAEDAFLLPLPVRALSGVGPATATALDKIGVRSVADLRNVGEATLLELLGRSAGGWLYKIARGEDERAVVASRETKSVGAERTFAADLRGRPPLEAALEVVCDAALRRLRRHGGAARTVVVKVRFSDFETVTRSVSLTHPSAERALLLETAQRGLTLVGFDAAVRLLGVSFHNLSDHAQLVLPLGRDGYDDEDDTADDLEDDTSGLPAPLTLERAAPGLDVEHPVHGRGWLAGLRGVEATVRFESATTGPGPVRTFDIRRAPLQVVDPAPPTGPQQ